MQTHIVDTQNVYKVVHMTWKKRAYLHGYTAMYIYAMP